MQFKRNNYETFTIIYTCVPVGMLSICAMYIAAILSHIENIFVAFIVLTSIKSYINQFLVNSIAFVQVILLSHVILCSTSLCGHFITSSILKLYRFFQSV